MKTIRKHMTTGLIAIALVVSTAMTAMAQYPPSSDFISVSTPGNTVVFHGQVKRGLALSDTGDIENTLRITTGRLRLLVGGCAAVKVEYLDGDGDTVGTDLALLAAPFNGLPVSRKVSEYDQGADHRDVRVRLLYGSSCGSMVEVGQYESDLP